MTKAPERIWASQETAAEWSKDGEFGDKPYDHVLDAYVEYIRVDAVSSEREALEAQNRDLLEALEELEGYIDGVIEDGCPKCGGDCSGANPPVSFCPIQQANKDLLKARAVIAKAKGEA